MVLRRALSVPLPSARGSAQPGAAQGTIPWPPGQAPPCCPPGLPLQPTPGPGIARPWPLSADTPEPSSSQAQTTAGAPPSSWPPGPRRQPCSPGAPAGPRGRPWRPRPMEAPPCWCQQTQPGPQARGSRSHPVRRQRTRRSPSGASGVGDQQGPLSVPQTPASRSGGPWNLRPERSRGVGTAGPRAPHPNPALLSCRAVTRACPAEGCCPHPAPPPGTPPRPPAPEQPRKGAAPGGGGRPARGRIHAAPAAPALTARPLCNLGCQEIYLPNYIPRVRMRACFPQPQPRGTVGGRWDVWAPRPRRTGRGPHPGVRPGARPTPAPPPPPAPLVSWALCLIPCSTC